MALPVKVQALYHMMWSNSGSPQLRNTPTQVNVVNLAFLKKTSALDESTRLPFLRKVGKTPEQLAKIQLKVTLPRELPSADPKP